MAVIQKKIKLVGSLGSKDELALFDSGASFSFIAPELAQTLGHIDRLPEPRIFGTARDGDQLTSTDRITIDFYIDGFRLSDEFLLIPELSEAVIIGASTLQKWRLKLDFEADDVIVDPRVTKMRLL